MASIVLKPRHERSLLRRHPWIFSGAIAKVRGLPQPGETVDILSSDGIRHGWGAYSPGSQIMVRVWTFEPNEDVSHGFFQARLQRAIKSRHPVAVGHNPVAYRLVNAESDGLPGLIVDRYAEFLVCQFLTAGAEYWKPAIVAGLNELVPNAGIYERSDVDTREREGLPKRTGVLSGKEPPDLVEVQEGPYRFLVDIRRGQKTGFYLDQRDNRAHVAEYAAGTEILNCFAYTGGFAVTALKAGAIKVTNVESSSAALALAQRNVELNGLDSAKVEDIKADVFAILRQYRDSRRRFDVVILDPPRFAESRSQLERASRGYKDINLLAFKLLRPAGVLFTFSCSGLIGRDLFEKILADAAVDAGRDTQILRWLTQAPDHPSPLNFPEGMYLKGLVCRVW
jgi:23S rRNA (cytosine1962-C5)-methyltransferase